MDRGRKEAGIWLKITTAGDCAAYCRAMWGTWFTAMSGPLSVPAAIAALWIENPDRQDIAWTYSLRLRLGCGLLGMEA